MAIIGSGYIGLEFQDVYTALGSEVRPHALVAEGLMHYWLKASYTSSSGYFGLVFKDVYTALGCDGRPEALVAEGHMH